MFGSQPQTDATSVAPQLEVRKKNDATTVYVCGCRSFGNNQAAT
jgi:hypothetical protein